MTCPFPGMDPYLEDRSIWPDFHSSYITTLRTLIQREIRPKYSAIVEERLYVVEHERSIRPDIAISRRRSDGRRTSMRAAVLDAEPDEPIRFPYAREEISEPYISIISSADRRVVTTIELLSPENKRAGIGRQMYLAKREEYLSAGVSVVEIDLLRGGEMTVHAGSERVRQIKSAWRYLVCVTRLGLDGIELYPIPLASRLPRIRVPLWNPDPDALLDLQLGFARCWEDGPYADLIDYGKKPSAPLTAEEKRQVNSYLKALRK